MHSYGVHSRGRAHDRESGVSVIPGLSAIDHSQHGLRLRSFTLVGDPGSGFFSASLSCSVRQFSRYFSLTEDLSEAGLSAGEHSCR